MVTSGTEAAYVIMARGGLGRNQWGQGTARPQPGLSATLRNAARARKRASA